MRILGTWWKCEPLGFSFLVSDSGHTSYTLGITLAPGSEGKPPCEVASVG